jgi:hypothetical protein
MCVHALSLLFLYKRICNLFASIDGGYNNEEGTTGDYKAEFAIADVAFIV